VLGFNYETPRFGSNKIVKNMLGGWTLSGILRYTSGMPIQTPGAQNNLNLHMLQSTTMNRVPGEPLFVKDLNCHCIDPNKELVLNPKAWSDPAQGDWGTSAAYYDDFRYQRRPDEQLSIGRSFRINNQQRFEVRAEFFNAFNRTQLNNPDAANPLQTQVTNAQGVPTSGFGRINTGSVYGPPRSGQIVMRYTW